VPGGGLDPLTPNSMRRGDTSCGTVLAGGGGWASSPTEGGGSGSRVEPLKANLYRETAFDPLQTLGLFRLVGWGPEAIQVRLSPRHSIMQELAGLPKVKTIIGARLLF
jgi:hypothetical protein